MIASSMDGTGALCCPIRLCGPVTSLHVFMCAREPHRYVPAVSLIPLPDCFHRVRAKDLRDAQRQSTALRTTAGNSGCTIFVDIEATVDPDVRKAMRAADAISPTAPGEEAVLRYVGTPLGLAGFIDDLHRLGIADGVTLRPDRCADRAEESINEVLNALIA